MFVTSWLDTAIFGLDFGKGVSYYNDVDIPMVAGGTCMFDPPAEA